MTTYEEWRVTGTVMGRPIDVTYRSKVAAMAFIVNDTPWPNWTDGPHLHKRTVAVTEWEEV